MLAAALLAVTACVATPAHAAPEDRKVLVLRGRITDPEQWPIGDVRVAAAGSRRASATTDHSGQYELKIPLGTPAELLRRPIALRVSAALRGWRTSLGGDDVLGLEVRAVPGDDGVVRCEIQSNHPRVTSAIARALMADGDATGVAQVNFTAERGVPAAPAEPALTSSERVALAGVSVPRRDARAADEEREVAREPKPAAAKPAPARDAKAATTKPDPPARDPKAVTTKREPPPRQPQPAAAKPEPRPASRVALPKSAAERAAAEAAARTERENQRALTEARRREKAALEAEARRQREETRARERLAKIARAEFEAAERAEAKRRRTEAKAAAEALEDDRRAHETRWNALRREVHLIAGASDTTTPPPVRVLEGMAGTPARAENRGRTLPRRAMLATRDTVRVDPPRALPQPVARAAPPPRATAAPPRPAPAAPRTDPAPARRSDTAPPRSDVPARAQTAPERTQAAPAPRSESAPQRPASGSQATAPARAGGAPLAQAGSPRIFPAPEGEARVRARPLLIRAPGPAAAAADTAAGGPCDCRIEGTVEVRSERPLPSRARVAVSLNWYPAIADTVELFMGSPRAFRLEGAPCGPQRLRVVSLGPQRFDVVSRDVMAGFRCTAGSLHQLRVVLEPR